VAAPYPSSGALSRVLRSVQRTRRGLARGMRRLAYGLFGAGTLIGAFFSAADPELVETIRGTLGHAIGAPATGLLVLGTLVFPFVRRSSRDAPVVLPGPLAAREPGAVVELTLRGEVHRIPVADFESGHVVPAHRDARGNGPLIDVPAKVVLERRGGDLWKLEVGDVDEGLELLAAVGLGPKARTLRLERRRPWSVLLAFLLTLLTLPLSALVVIPAAPVLPPYALGYLLLVLWLGTGYAILGRLQPSALAIGGDGIAWREGRTPRFVAHRDVRDARLGFDGKPGGSIELVLTTAAGEVHIPLGPIGPAHLHSALAHVLAARGEARAAATALARGGRDFAEWSQALGRAMASDYRQPGVPKVRVLETLEDPHAPADQRLGAAIALATTDPERARALAQHAARAAADPALAEALEAFADARLDARRAEAVTGD
jgi:hypothetical protein